jgi:hypothetical protein
VCNLYSLNKKRDAVARFFRVSHNRGAAFEPLSAIFPGESEAVRVAAIKELFDRGYGRSVQPIQGEMTYGVSQQLADLFKGNDGNTLGAEIARRAALPPPNGEQPH